MTHAKPPYLLSSNRLASTMIFDQLGQVTDPSHGYLCAGKNTGKDAWLLWHSCGVDVLDGNEWAPLETLDKNAPFIAQPSGAQRCIAFSNYKLSQRMILDRDLSRCSMEFHNQSRRPLTVRLVPRMLCRPAGATGLSLEPAEFTSKQQEARIVYASWPQALFLNCFQSSFKHRLVRSEQWTYADGSQEDLHTPWDIEHCLYPGERLTLTMGQAPANFVALPSIKATNPQPSNTWTELSDAAYRRSYVPFNGDGHAELVSGHPVTQSELRNQFIMLPGILLTRSAWTEAKHILEWHLKYPQTLLASGDSTLWFIRAFELYVSMARDQFFLSTHLPTIIGWVDQIFNGTHPSLHIDASMLLREHAQSSDDSDLLQRPRFMPLIPARSGFHLHTNLLWLHGLYVLDAWTQQRGSSKYTHFLPALRSTIRQEFWMSAFGYPAAFTERLGRGPSDTRISPLAVIGLSLASAPFSPLDSVNMIKRIEQELWTPYGLRSIRPNNVDYDGHAGQSGPSQRAVLDSGACKPWLLSFYYEAWQRHASQRALAPMIIGKALERLLESNHSRIAGSIAESFAGDAPHAPMGSLDFGPSVAAALWAAYSIKSDQLAPTDKAATLGVKIPVA